MDPRAERSASLIRGSLLDMLQSSEYDEVTVADVCSRAGICRSTFYAHYRRLDDVLDELIDEALSEPCRRYRLCKLDGDSYECPYAVCDKVREHPEYAAILFNERLADRVIARIFSSIGEEYVRSMITRCDLTPSEALAIFAFQINGCLGVNRMMLSEGSDALEKSRDLIGGFILGGLRHYRKRFLVQFPRFCPGIVRHPIIPVHRNTVMDIGKLQPAIIIAVAILGLIAGSVTFLENSPAWTIQLPLMAMLFVLFLSVDLGSVRGAVGNARFACSALILNFVVTPAIAFILGMAFFDGVPDMRIGLMMLLVTPCTDWYLVFTRLGGGDVELGMSILPLNLILQILLLPFYLSVFFGTDAGMNIPSLLFDMTEVLIVPMALAIAIKRISWNEKSEKIISSKGNDIQLAFMCIAVFFMFASEGKEVTSNPELLAWMFFPLLLFFGLMFILAKIVGMGLGFPRKSTVSLTFTVMARNSPLSLAIAAIAFPDHPLISLALVIGPLIELPVLSVTAWATKKWVSNDRENSISQT